MLTPPAQRKSVAGTLAAQNFISVTSEQHLGLTLNLCPMQAVRVKSLRWSRCGMFRVTTDIPAAKVIMTFTSVPSSVLHQA